MLKSLTSLLFLLFCFTTITAQQSNSDSLKQELAASKNDTNKVSLLANLAWLYVWSAPDSGILYAQQALELARKLNFANGQLKAYAPLVEAFSSKGNYPKALEAALKKLEVAQKSRDSTKIISSYGTIGSVYYYASDYKRALDNYRKLTLNRAIFTQYQELFSGFLGETYFHLNKLDSAFYYLKISYDLDVRSGAGWSVPYYYLGEIYATRKEYVSALGLYHRGIELSSDKLDFLNGYIGIAGVFKKMNSPDSAVYYARQAIGLVPGRSFPAQIVQASEILTRIYATHGPSDSNLKYTQILMVAKDTLFSRAKQNLAFNEQMYQQDLRQKIEQQQLAGRNRQNIIILLAGLAIALTVAIGLWRRNIYKQRSYSILQKQKQEIDIQKTKVEKTLEELKTAQAQLIQSEKMASLGELTAGIAHEIQNPLNFVNNFSEVNDELISDLVDEVDRGNYDEVKVIAANLKDNEQKIIQHGKRADAIVKGMLQHTRISTGQKEATDINALADEYLRLSYHGMRARDKNFSATLQTDFDPSIGKINVVPQDIGRVLLNLFNNAFYETNQKLTAHNSKLDAEGSRYVPAVTLVTRKVNDKIEIRVKDNGPGIPQYIIDKIFQPFFTTKPTGEGTGLGLSLSYDIIKAHGGEIKVETIKGEGSEFVIQLPVTPL